MTTRRLFPCLCLSVLCLAVASQASGLANRVFVSARSGNDANSCDNIATPCQTFTGAIAQLNPNGEAIVLDSGGYGKVTITQSVTIESPPGVTAFIHPSSGDAITINAGSSDEVTLRGLVLNKGSNIGIVANSVGTLRVEDCSITEFGFGIRMASAGRLIANGTNIASCEVGIHIANTAGLVQASVDHCHLDGNTIGFQAESVAPGASATAGSSSTANNNTFDGWSCGNASNGKNVLNLEFCTGSQNGGNGLISTTMNAQTVARYSNSAFVNNAQYGVRQFGTGAVETRGNNTITGNTLAPTSGTIGPFSPM